MDYGPCHAGMVDRDKPMNTLTDWQANKPGVYFGLSELAYHANKDAISSSMLRHPWSLAHLHASLESPDDEESVALFLGTAIHTVYLEPTKPLPGIVVRPETYPAPVTHADVKARKILACSPLPWNGRASFCAEWEAQQEAAGNRILTRKEFEAIEGCRKSLVGNAWLRRNVLAAGSENEVSILIGDPLLKARIDCAPAGANFIVDIKTCRVGDASPERWPKVMAERKYHWQASWYLDLWNAQHPHDQRTGFVFAAVEKEPPYALGLHHVSASAIEIGRRENTARLAELIDAIESGVWPGYPTEPVICELPGWVK